MVTRFINTMRDRIARLFDKLASLESDLHARIRAAEDKARDASLRARSVGNLADTLYNRLQRVELIVNGPDGDKQDQRTRLLEAYTIALERRVARLEANVFPDRHPRDGDGNNNGDQS